MRSPLPLGLLAAAVLLAGAAPPDGSTPASAASSANTAAFTDAVGDNGGAPDIASVVVSNDDVGLVELAVVFADRTALAPGELFTVDLDTDQATPDWEYAIQVLGGAATQLFRYDRAAGTWAAAPAPSLAAAWTGNTLKLTISIHDLTWARSFRFQTYVDVNPADEAAPFDLAPDTTEPWRYDVAVPMPALVVASLDGTREPVVPGRTMTTQARVEITRAGLADVLPPSTTVTWRATAGKATLFPRATRQDGAELSAAWKLPAKMTAKSVQVTVTVNADGVSATRTRAFRIAPRPRSGRSRFVFGARAGATRVRPVFKLMLLTPAHGAVVAQNDPSTGCSAHPTRGYGHRLPFAWRVNQPGAVTAYRLHAQNRSAQFPTLDFRLPTNVYTFVPCHGFVIDTYLNGWVWRVEALSGETVRASRTREFSFAPCRLSDGTPCWA